MKASLSIVASFVLFAADAHAAVCPAAVPTNGAPCDAGGWCEYGGDAHGLCATFAECTSDAWKVDTVDAGCGKSPPDCPSAFDAVEAGARCPLADPTALCVYAEGACSCPRPCSQDGGEVDWQWECRAWAEGDPGCPSARPALGTACDQDGQTCSWNGCCWGVFLGPDESCDNGQWTLHPDNSCACAQPLACPFPIADAAPNADASLDGSTGDEESHVPPPSSSGCDCTFAEASSAPGGFVVAIGLMLATRRRRRR